MSKAVSVVRQSQGTHDSISLSIQREKVAKLANELADEHELIDLGVHSGFSIHMSAEKDDRLDLNPQIQQLLTNLRDGKYDYLIAYDDTRLARDQFYWEIKRATIEGDCELHFVKDVPDGDLSFRVQRVVESEVKMKEIRKSIEAVEAREDQGYDHGRPPFGLTFDEDGRYWVPDEDEFETALEVLDLRDAGDSFRKIAEKIDEVGREKARGIVQRREKYEKYQNEQEVEA